MGSICNALSGAQRMLIFSSFKELLPKFATVSMPLAGVNARMLARTYRSAKKPRRRQNRNGRSNKACMVIVSRT
jgi:hypothetical protein